MQIWVKTLTGKRTELNVDENDLALKVKQLLQEKEGIPVQQMRLVFNGKQLDDEVKLMDKGVKAGSTVHMILTLRG